MKTALKLGMVSLALAVALTGCGGGGGGGGGAPAADQNPVANSGGGQPVSSTSYSYTEPYETEQWYLHRQVANDLYGADSDINLDPIITQYTGAGVKVGFIVSDPDTNHEDLVDRIKGFYNIGAGTTGNPDHDTSIMGPAVASVNNLGIRGVAPDADVYLINLDYPFTDQEYANAYNKAVDLGLDVLIVTRSIQNGGDNATVVNAIKNAIASGVTIVFSAGNEGDDLDNVNPEYNMPEAIIAGAYDEYNYPLTIGGFSNYGNNLDILAPGQSIITTIPNNQYDYQSGTSYSSPIVGGVIALMKQANPNLTPAQIDEILHKSADKIDDADCQYDQTTGKSYYCGYGKINAEKAVQMALAY